MSVQSVSTYSVSASSSEVAANSVEKKDTLDSSLMSLLRQISGMLKQHEENTTGNNKKNNQPVTRSASGDTPAVSDTPSSTGSAGGKTAGTSSTASQMGTNSSNSSDTGRQTLAADHGWGAQGGGTTGGAKATQANVYTVSNRQQLIDALGGNNKTNGTNNTPKIIYIKGTIDMNLGADGKEMTKAQYGSEQAQLAQVMAKVGSNTSIVGLGANAGIINGGLDVSNSHNDIIRNVNFASPYDFFQGKDAEGNPHGRVYSIEAKGTTNLWVDHNTFKDGTAPAGGGITGDQIDFTNGANYGTFSYNQFDSHNKSILIGSSDSTTSDAGKLNVTIDHNEFSDITQRAPRVRYGHVEVANNLYNVSASSQHSYQYSMGVGKDAHITSQNNAFETTGVNASALVKNFGSGGGLTDSGTLVNGKAVNLSTGSGQNAAGAGAIKLDATANVAAIVQSSAGAGNLGKGD